MRRTGKIGLIAASLLYLCACNRAAPLATGANGIHQSVVEAPRTDTKTDRPTETGEGLPGYLIDPAQLAIDTTNNTTTVTGSLGAVRHQSGTIGSVNVWMIKAAKRTAKFQKQDQDWQLAGTRIAAAKVDAQGSFSLKGTIAADELLFVKLEDSTGPDIHYKSGVVALSVLWIEGQTVKNIDGSSAAQIKAQITALQPDPSADERARLIEQVKTTGQCRNCNLAGADLSGLDIAGCDLSFSNLMGAKFILSNLSACTITSSNLSQTDFTQANLSGANLTNADISGANFNGANTVGVTGALFPVQ